MGTQRLSDMGTEQARRVRAFFVSPEALVDLFREGNPVALSFKGLPADARFVSAYYEPEYRQFLIAVESESWPLVSPGNVLVRFQIEIIKHAEFEPLEAPDRDAISDSVRQFFDNHIAKQEQVKEVLREALGQID